MMQRFFAALTLFMLSGAALAISPYLYGDKVSGENIQAVASAVEGKLKCAGFKVIGRYFPRKLPGYGVVIATDEKILAEIGDLGENTILGAGLRVGIKSDGTVSYMNPNYWYRAYFRGHFANAESSVKALQARLSGALGDGGGFGGDESAKSLANYRYMVGMERLESGKSKLAGYDSYGEAVKTVRDNLARGLGKTSKVYEVSMPDKKIAVFGVAMNDEEQGDGLWIKKIGMEESIAGLPYEIYVVNGEVHSPHGRFRIALAFPDVGMGQFMRISSLPNDIQEIMAALAGVVHNTTP